VIPRRAEKRVLKTHQSVLDVGLRVEIGSTSDTLEIAEDVDEGHVISTSSFHHFWVKPPASTPAR
jgi:hypothetical protein